MHRKCNVNIKNNMCPIPEIICFVYTYFNIKNNMYDDTKSAKIPKSACNDFWLKIRI